MNTYIIKCLNIQKIMIEQTKIPTNKVKPYKVIMVGGQAVGKSSLLFRIIESKFDPSYTSTIGVDFKTVSVAVGQKQVVLQIWDTAGQEKFRSLTQTYFRGAQGCICVYDINDGDSLIRAEQYVQDAFEHKIKPDCVFLLANKADEQKDNTFQQKGRELANKLDINFMRVSAKTGQAINLLISNLASKIESIHKSQGQSKEERDDSRRPRIRIDQHQGRGACGC